MKYIGVWALGLALIGVACTADQTSSQGITTESSSGALLDEAMKLKQPSVHIEGRVAQVNLVSDDTAKIPAAVADPHLLNAWGLTFPTSGPAWISANGEGTLDVYNGTGTRLLEVAIPSTSPTGDPATPTGQVFNADSGSFAGDSFIAVTEDGAVIAWQSSDGGTALVRRNDAPSVYKGVAIGSAHGEPHLYAADFHNGRVAVFDSHYRDAHLWGSFIDRHLPDGYGPFNIANAGPFLLVSYAKQDAAKHDDVKGAGFGFVDLFTTEGFFVQRLISRGALNAPWAMVFALDREHRSVDLLVGNFGDGKINVYDLSLRHDDLVADHEGELGDQSGNPLVIDGLWALHFGSGGAGFDTTTLYFTAGPNDEADGLFGSLSFGGRRH